MQCLGTGKYVAPTRLPPIPLSGRALSPVSSTSYLQELGHCTWVRPVLRPGQCCQQHSHTLGVQRPPHHHSTPQQQLIQAGVVVTQLGCCPSDGHDMLGLQRPGGQEQGEGVRGREVRIWLQKMGCCTISAAQQCCKQAPNTV
jgi:hypothetical protein